MDLADETDKDVYSTLNKTPALAALRYQHAADSVFEKITNTFDEISKVLSTSLSTPLHGLKSKSGPDSKDAVVHTLLALRGPSTITQEVKPCAKLAI